MATSVGVRYYAVMDPATPEGRAWIGAGVEVVPIEGPEPVNAGFTSAGGRRFASRCVKADVEEIPVELLFRIVDHLADRFGLGWEEVADLVVGEPGIPILASHVLICTDPDEARASLSERMAAP